MRRHRILQTVERVFVSNEFFNEDLPNKDRILINQVAEFN